MQDDAAIARFLRTTKGFRIQGFSARMSPQLEFFENTEPIDPVPQPQSSSEPVTVAELHITQRIRLYLSSKCLCNA